jgi:hypothetical protein
VSGHPEGVAFLASVSAPVPAAEFYPVLLRAGFSIEAYRHSDDDPHLKRLNDTDVLWHFLRHGLDERRRAPLTLDRDAFVALARLPLGDRAFRAKLLSSLGSHLLDGVGHPFGQAFAERWPTVLTLIGEGARPYFLAGDSHSNQYNLTGDRNGEWLLPLHLLCTAGSASGLANPRSASGYGGHLRQAVREIGSLPNARELPFLMQFGQVDLEFVHHYQRARNGERALKLHDYRAFCAATVKSYMDFATRLFRPRQRANVFFVSVFPPVLSDAALKRGYLNEDIAQREGAGPPEELRQALLALEFADLTQRTRIHAEFNLLLRESCTRHGFGFVDGFTPFLGPNGLAHPEYVDPDKSGAEHHLDARRTFDVAAAVVWHCIDALTAG